MKFNFSFNSKTHDFWEIYHSIKKYYPIGLEQHLGEGIYYEYKGLRELEKIIVDNVHNDENYKERWVKFTDEMGHELNKEINGTTYGQAPSYSSSIILFRNTVENCLHVKALHFAVSFVGDYFQIYGLDLTTILDEVEERGFRKGYTAVNSVTSSPFAEFEETFKYVEQKLRLRYVDELNCSVNMALFNQTLSGSENSRGDSFYGNDDWLK